MAFTNIIEEVVLAALRSLRKLNPSVNLMQKIGRLAELANTGGGICLFAGQVLGMVSASATASSTRAVFLLSLSCRAGGYGEVVLVATPSWHIVCSTCSMCIAHGRGVGYGGLYRSLRECSS